MSLWEEPRAGVRTTLPVVSCSRDGLPTGRRVSPNWAPHEFASKNCGIVPHMRRRLASKEGYETVLTKTS